MNFRTSLSWDLCWNQNPRRLIQALMTGRRGMLKTLSPLLPMSARSVWEDASGLQLQVFGCTGCCNTTCAVPSAQCSGPVIQHRVGLPVLSIELKRPHKWYCMMKRKNFSSSWKNSSSLSCNIHLCCPRSAEEVDEPQDNYFSHPSYEPVTGPRLRSCVEKPRHFHVPENNGERVHSTRPKCAKPQ